MDCAHEKETGVIPIRNVATRDLELRVSPNQKEENSVIRYLPSYKFLGVFHVNGEY